MAKLTVKRIPGPLNSLVLQQDEERTFFVGTSKGIVISVPTLSYILNFLVQNGYLDYQVLQGILSDYFTDRGSKK